LQFVRCKLTGASAGEHPVLVVVRHRFLLSNGFRIPSPNTYGKSTVETA
jgi:hypothetical protein